MKIAFNWLWFWDV